MEYYFLNSITNLMVFCFLDLGEANAMFRYGILKINGIGIDKNQKEGAQYIKRDANLGHPKAMLMYGKLLSEGTGVERDGIKFTIHSNGSVFWSFRCCSNV